MPQSKQTACLLAVSPSCAYYPIKLLLCGSDLGTKTTKTLVLVCALGNVFFYHLGGLCLNRTVITRPSNANLCLEIQLQERKTMTSRVSRLSLSHYERKSTQDQAEINSSKEDSLLEDENEVYSEPFDLANESKLVQLMVHSLNQRDLKTGESTNGEDRSPTQKQQNKLKTKAVENLQKKSAVGVSKLGTTGNKPHSSASSLDTFQKEKLNFLTVKNEFGRFPCLWCKRAYATEYNLRRHGLKHKEVKNKQMFHCGECWRKFDRRDMLKKHSLTHKNDRPHVCGICRRRFKHKSHLNDHMKLDRCFKNDKAKYY